MKSKSDLPELAAITRLGKLISGNVLAGDKVFTYKYLGKKYMVTNAETEGGYPFIEELKEPKKGDGDAGELILN